MNVQKKIQLPANTTGALILSEAEITDGGSCSVKIECGQEYRWNPHETDGRNMSFVISAIYQLIYEDRVGITVGISAVDLNTGKYEFDFQPDYMVATWISERTWILQK